MSEKQAYYVDLVSGDILADPPRLENPNFKIYADDEELAEIKSNLQKSYSADMQAFARSHVPYLLYHHDQGNDKYDGALKNIYQLIYQYGDEEAKRFIDDNKILIENKYEGSKETEHFK